MWCGLWKWRSISLGRRCMSWNRNWGLQIKEMPRKTTRPYHWNWSPQARSIWRLVYGLALLSRALSLLEPSWSEHWLYHRGVVPLLKDIKHNYSHAICDTTIFQLMWQVTFLSHHINLQQKAAGCSRGRRLCRAGTWDLCIWCVRRHILREGQCVFPLPQLHSPCMRHLVTGRERWDGKNTKGRTGAVIKSLVNVILLCGMSKACSEFLPARGGGTSPSRQLACENDRDAPELPVRLHSRAHKRVWGSWWWGSVVPMTGSSSPES